MAKLILLECFQWKWEGVSLDYSSTYRWGSCKGLWWWGYIELLSTCRAGIKFDLSVFKFHLTTLLPVVIYITGKALGNNNPTIWSMFLARLIILVPKCNFYKIDRRVCSSRNMQCCGETRRQFYFVRAVLSVRSDVLWKFSSKFCIYCIHQYSKTTHFLSLDNS